MDRYSETNRKISIAPLSRFNWEQALELELHDYQEGYLPEMLFSLAQSKFEQIEPLGIFADEKMVGVLMYGDFGGIFWINRLMIDKAYQEMGIGQEAVAQLLKKLRKHPEFREIRTSFVKQNALAEYFFTKMGFQRIGDGLDDEIVMRWKG